MLVKQQLIEIGYTETMLEGMTEDEMRDELSYVAENK